MVVITLFHSCFLWLVLTISYYHTAAKEPFNSFPALFFLKKKVSGFRKDIRDGLAQQSSQVMGMPSTPSWLVFVRTFAGEGVLASISGRHFSLWTTNKQKVFLQIAPKPFHLHITGLSFIPYKARLPALSRLPPLPPKAGREQFSRHLSLLSCRLTYVLGVTVTLLCPSGDAPHKWAGRSCHLCRPVRHRTACNSSYVLVSTGNLVQYSVTVLFSQVML